MIEIVFKFYFFYPAFSKRYCAINLKTILIFHECFSVLLEEDVIKTVVFHMVSQQGELHPWMPLKMVFVVAP